MTSLFTYFSKKLNTFFQYNPYEYAIICLKCMNATLTPIGINVGTTCRVTLLSYLCGFGATQHFLLTIYTAYYFWNINKIACIQPFTLFGISMPGFALYAQLIGPNRFRARELVQFTINNVFQNRMPKNQYDKEQLRLAKYTLKRTIFCILYILCSFPLILVGPVYAYIVNHQKSIPTGIILPFIDPNSSKGFALNAIFQGFIGLIAGLGLMGFEIFVNIADCNLNTIAELAIYQLRNFSDNIKKNTNETLHYEFRYIAIMLEDVKNFIGLFNQILYWKFLMQPITVNICVSIGIFCQYTNDWAPGYGVAVCLYIQLIVLCFCGNNVIVVCETIQTELYNVKWYLLPRRLRKHLLIVLIKWQTGMTLTIGPFGVLNYEIASVITRRIYTLLMVLLNYF